MRFVAYAVASGVWAILEHSLRVVEVARNIMVIVNDAGAACVRMMGLAARLRWRVPR